MASITACEDSFDLFTDMRFGFGASILGSLWDSVTVSIFARDESVVVDADLSSPEGTLREPSVDWRWILGSVVSDDPSDGTSSRSLVGKLAC